MTVCPAQVRALAIDPLPTKAHDKCRVRIERLKELGHELRRPEADYLRDGIYELRTKHAGVNYRMLCFFHRNVAAVVSQGLVKEQAVPPAEIDRAIERKRRFEKSPDRYMYREKSNAE
jgi:phage-related protein